MPMAPEALCRVATDALEARKLAGVTVLDVSSLTDVCDYMVIASGRSRRQVITAAEHVVEKAKAAGQRPLGVEGMREGEWVLVDLCDVVVHVMTPGARELYQLEKLWTPRSRPASTSGEAAG